MTYREVAIETSARRLPSGRLRGWEASRWREWPTRTQKVRSRSREDTSRSTRPLKIPLGGHAIRTHDHVSQFVGSVTPRPSRLHHRIQVPPVPEVWTELGIKGRRVRTNQEAHQRPLRRNGCRRRLPPTDHPVTLFQQIAYALPSACPYCRRLTANRGLKRLSTPRSIKRSAAVDCPHQVGSQADSAGSIPVTRSTREKRHRSYGFTESSSLFAIALGAFQSTADDPWAIRGPQVLTSRSSHRGQRHSSRRARNCQRFCCRGGHDSRGCRRGLGDGPPQPDL